MSTATQHFTPTNKIAPTRGYLQTGWTKVLAKPHPGGSKMEFVQLAAGPGRYRKQAKKRLKPSWLAFFSLIVDVKTQNHSKMSFWVILDPIFQKC